MKVKEIMTENPIVAELPGTRSEVLKQLVKHNVTGMPVIKSVDGTLAGFVTRQDIFTKPEEEQLALVMRRDYPTINVNASVKDAARIMVDQDLSHLPVQETSMRPRKLLIQRSKGEDDQRDYAACQAGSDHEARRSSARQVPFGGSWHI